MTDYYVTDCIKIPVSFLRAKGVFDGPTSGAIYWGKCSLGYVYRDGVLLFVYDHEGQTHKVAFKIETRPTNLGIGTRVFAKCPTTGKLCTKFYVTPSGEILTRPSMKGVRYEQQDDSRYWRVVNTLRRYDDDRRRRYGKMYYNGKLTPYGYRVLRSDEKSERAGVAWLSMIMKRHGDG